MGGFNMVDFSKENGYGTPSDKANSNGVGTYDPQPMSAPPINGGGKDDFSEPRFSGNGGTPSPLGSEPSGKSAIKIG